LIVVSRCLSWKRFQRDILTWVKKTLDFVPYIVQAKQDFDLTRLQENDVTIRILKGEQIEIYLGKQLYTSFESINAMIPKLNRACVILTYQDGVNCVMVNNEGRVPFVNSLSEELTEILDTKCVDMGSYEDICVYTTLKDISLDGYGFCPEKVAILTNETTKMILSHPYVESLIENHKTCLICSEIVEEMRSACIENHNFCLYCCGKLKNFHSNCPMCKNALLL